MSKRSKKNRQSKLPLPPQAAKRGSPRYAVIFLAALMLALGVGWWKFTATDIFFTATATTGQSHSQFQKLTGRWQRPDGGYVLEIKSVTDDGSMDAAYFNPRSIRVAKAEASRDGAATKIFVELRDVNYPGSTYTLTHDAASDQLKGIYYQAVEKQRFPVAFVRMK